MKIDPNYLPPVGRLSPSDHAREGDAVRTQDGRAKEVDRDRANLSVDGSKLEELRAEVARLPEVRQERVAELQKAIRENRYQVSDEQIAEAIFQELTKPSLR